jgi:hypothetical protein
VTSPFVGQRGGDRPLLLDLFCCAGGIAKGYHRAGFDVLGVDKDPQPRYPFRFVQADALEFLQRMVDGGTWEWIGPSLFAAVHASPPCQARSDLQKQSKLAYREYVDDVRELLKRWPWGGIPYVIENVEGEPAHDRDRLIDPVILCGASPVFASSGLRVIRHRLFESNLPLVGAPCPTQHPLVFTYDKRKAHYGRLDQNTSFVQVTGGGNATVANKAAAMGIDWMTGRELNEAIPPAYGEFIGAQIMRAIRTRAGEKEAA